MQLEENINNGIGKNIKFSNMQNFIIGDSIPVTCEPGIDADMNWNVHNKAGIN